jgi:hypothetical protein
MRAHSTQCWLRTKSALHPIPGALFNKEQPMVSYIMDLTECPSTSGCRYGKDESLL